jgi:hypothetical protein
MNEDGPLAGIRVLDLTRMPAMPSISSASIATSVR